MNNQEKPKITRKTYGRRQRRKSNIDFKKPLGILLMIVVLWVMFPPPGFYGLIFVILIFWTLYLFTVYKMEKEVVKIDIKKPEENKEEKARDFERGRTRNNEQDTTRQIRYEGYERRDEQGGKLQNNTSKSNGKSKQESGRSKKRNKSTSIAIPSVEPVES